MYPMNIEVDNEVLLVDLLRAMRGIGLRPRSMHPLRFERIPNHEPPAIGCSVHGCTRPGAIQWESGGALFCADHAWLRKPSCC
jgi:hypothetical protein